MVLTETKLNDYFPNSQSLVDDLSERFRTDRNRSRDRVMIYVQGDIPSKQQTKLSFLVISRVFL